MQVKIFDPLRCRWSDGSDTHAADLTGVVVKLEENIEKRFDAIHAREHDPVVAVGVLHQLREFAQVAGRLEPDRG